MAGDGGSPCHRRTMSGGRRLAFSPRSSSERASLFGASRRSTGSATAASSCSPRVPNDDAPNEARPRVLGRPARGGRGHRRRRPREPRRLRAARPAHLGRRHALLHRRPPRRGRVVDRERPPARARGAARWTSERAPRRRPRARRLRGARRGSRASPTTRGFTDSSARCPSSTTTSPCGSFRGTLPACSSLRRPAEPRHGERAASARAPPSSEAPWRSSWPAPPRSPRRAPIVPTSSTRPAWSPSTSRCARARPATFPGSTRPLGEARPISLMQRAGMTPDEIARVRFVHGNIDDVIQTVLSRP